MRLQGTVQPPGDNLYVLTAVSSPSSPFQRCCKGGARSPWHGRDTEVPRREPRAPPESERGGRVTGQGVTFLTWGQLSRQTAHKASLPLCRRLSGPTTFQAFFGVLVARGLRLGGK